MQTKSDAAQVGLSGIIVSLTGFLVLLVVARGLTPVELTSFMVYWAVFFLCVAVLVGVQAEATRAVRAEEPGKTPIFQMALIAGLVVGGLAVAVTLATGLDFGQPGLRGFLIIVLGLGCVGYAAQAHTLGVLAGLGRWTPYAYLAAGEATLRLLACLVVWVIAASITSFAVATTLAVFVWLLVGLFAPGVRLAWGTRIALPPKGYAKRLGLAMTFAGANAVMINGFPLLMSVSTPAVEYAQEGALILAVSLSRAPIMMPLVIFQSMLIAIFVDHPERAAGTLTRVGLGAGVVAVVGAGAGYLVGPWLMTFFFGAGYEIAGWVIAGLVVAAVALGLLTLAGAISLALDRHSISTFGWYLALAITLAAMFLLPYGLAVRTILALTLGPLTGAIAILTLTRRRHFDPSTGKH